MFSVLSVNGALRADGPIAGEAIISEFFFGVVVAGIGGLVEGLFGGANP